MNLLIKLDVKIYSVKKKKSAAPILNLIQNEV